MNRGNCPPNVVDENGSTPLHIAASQGKAYIVELLLLHQDIDVVSSFKFLLYCVDMSYICLLMEPMFFGSSSVI